MLEFTIILDNNVDTLTILGPTDLKVEGEINSIDDMCKLFKKYMLEFCQKIHFDNYRIDKIKNCYQLSKDNESTRSKWDYISTHSTYFDAYEAMCDAKYEDECCPMGYCDCIFQDSTEFCKDCVSMNGYYYDDEDK